MNDPENISTGTKVRNVPIKRLPDPEVDKNTNARTVPIKRLDQESRFLLHTNPVERTIKAGDAISPELNSRRHYGVNLAQQYQKNRNKVDGL